MNTAAAMTYAMTAPRPTQRPGALGREMRRCIDHEDEEQQGEESSAATTGAGHHRRADHAALRVVGDGSLLAHVIPPMCVPVFRVSLGGLPTVATGLCRLCAERTRSSTPLPLGAARRHNAVAGPVHHHPMTNTSRGTRPMPKAKHSNTGAATVTI